MRTLEISELKSVSGGLSDVYFMLGCMGAISLLATAPMAVGLYFFQPNEAAHNARFAEVALIKSNFADLMGTLSTVQQSAINAYVSHKEHVADITGFVHGMGSCR